MKPQFVLAETTISVDLHPSALRDIAANVRSILHSRVLTYSKEHSGVIMGFQDDRIVSSTAPVHTFFPYIHVKATAKLLVFVLKKNQLMEGQVDQVGADYIGLKVMSGLGAVVHYDQLSPKFMYNKQTKSWRSTSSKKKQIKKGSKVVFKFKRVDTAGDKFIIVGHFDANACPDPRPEPSRRLENANAAEQDSMREANDQLNGVHQDGGQQAMQTHKSVDAKDSKLGKQRKSAKGNAAANGMPADATPGDPDGVGAEAQKPGKRKRSYGNVSGDEQAGTHGALAGDGLDGLQALTSADGKVKKKKKKLLSKGKDGREGGEAGGASGVARAPDAAADRLRNMTMKKQKVKKKSVGVGGGQRDDVVDVSVACAASNDVPRAETKEAKEQEKRVSDEGLERAAEGEEKRRKKRKEKDMARKGKGAGRTVSLQDVQQIDGETAKASGREDASGGSRKHRKEARLSVQADGVRKKAKDKDKGSGKKKKRDKGSDS